MARRKRNKAGKKDDKSSAETLPETPRQLPLAGPSAVTPELQRAMSDDDVSEIISSTASMSLSPQLQAEEVSIFPLPPDTMKRVRGKEGELEASLNQITEQISGIRKKWEDGKINMARRFYTTELNKSLKTQQELMRRLSLLWTKTAALSGDWAADVLSEGITRDSNEDWTLIDAVLRCYPELEFARKSIKSRRTEQQQVLFEKKLVAAYDCGPNNETARFYCPIKHGRVETSKAAHIVNVNVGAKTAEALFGDCDDHIWSPKNGLIIHSAYARLLDNAMAVILPASDGPEETELVFFLLTRNIGPEATDVWGYETLHGRRLQFLNRYRPSKSFLYFRATMTLLRRRRAEVDGHWNDIEQLPAVAKTMWATPGPYLKNSILYRFSRELGCLSKAEAKLFWNTDTDAALSGLSEQRSKRAAAFALRASHAALTTSSSKDEDDEDEDDDDEDDDGDDDFNLFN